MAIANRPGARPVSTPTKPGQVTLSYGPAPPSHRVTTSARPSPSNGQSSVRNSVVPPSDRVGDRTRGAAPLVGMVHQERAARLPSSARRRPRRRCRGWRFAPPSGATGLVGRPHSGRRVGPPGRTEQQRQARRLCRHRGKPGLLRAGHIDHRDRRQVRRHWHRPLVRHYRHWMVPRPPSTSSIWPFARCCMAPRAAITAGMPCSRAAIAPCDKRPAALGDDAGGAGEQGGPGRGGGAHHQDRSGRAGCEVLRRADDVGRSRRLARAAGNAPQRALGRHRLRRVGQRPGRGTGLLPGIVALGGGDRRRPVPASVPAGPRRSPAPARPPGEEQVQRIGQRQPVRQAHAQAPGRRGAATAPAGRCGSVRGRPARYRAAPVAPAPATGTPGPPATRRTGAAALQPPPAARPAAVARRRWGIQPGGRRPPARSRARRPRWGGTGSASSSRWPWSRSSAANA